MVNALTEMVTFHEDDHSYWLGIERIPSVSEILRPLTDTYLASIPEHILNHKRDIGLAVHKACELLDLGTLDEETVDDRVLPYLEGYKKFLVDYAPKWTGVEMTVFNETARYAGRLDRMGAIASGPAIIDIKTSVSVRKTTALQLWAYECAALEPADPLPDLLALQLLPTGNYKIHTFDNVLNYAMTWDGLLALYRWNKENSR